MLAERENQIIGMIYDAALNASLWQDVLSAVVDFTGSSTAIFTATHQLSPNYDFVFTHNIPEKSLQAYQDEDVKILDMRLHVPHWMEKALGDTVLNSFEPYALMPVGTDEYIFYEKCAKPTNISHVAAVLLERSMYSWAVFAVHRAPQLVHYNHEEEAILRRLGIHIRRALQIYRQMVILKQEKENIYSVLDLFKLGVILLEQDGRLFYSNQASRRILENTELLKLDRNNQLKTSKNFQLKLDDFIQGALLKHRCSDQPSGGVLALFDDHEESSLMLSILPFSEPFNLNAKKIMILVTETNQHQSLSQDYLTQKYKLSKREFEVCELFLKGLSLDQIAAEMDITYGSIRIYIKNIFNKTACTTQAELMQLLMGAKIEFEHIQ